MKDNATASEMYGRSYLREIPDFLRSRPPAFLKHCMAKLDLADTINAEHIERTSQKVFEVNT